MNNSENKKHLSALEKIDEILLRCDELQQEFGLETKFTLFDPALEDQKVSALVKNTISSFGKDKEDFQNSFNPEFGLKQEETDIIRDLMSEMQLIKILDTNHGIPGQGKTTPSFSLMHEGYKRINELKNENSFLFKLTTIQWAAWISVVLSTIAIVLSVPLIQRWLHLE